MESVDIGNNSVEYVHTKNKKQICSNKKSLRIINDPKGMVAQNAIVLIIVSNYSSRVYRYIFKLYFSGVEQHQRYDNYRKKVVEHNRLRCCSMRNVNDVIVNNCTVEPPLPPIPDSREHRKMQNIIVFNLVIESNCQ